MIAIDFIRNLLVENPQEADDFSLSFKEKEFNKKEIITDYNQVEKNIYFINSGIVEVVILKNGEEKVIDFFFPNNFVCSYTSFILQTPSDVQVKALTDCQVETLGYRELQDAYKHSFVSNKLGRLLTEQVYIMKSDREKEFLTKSAGERYLNLISKRPELVQLIPLKKIAQYLGVYPESLSRIRKDIIS